jgi:hypothetical protein
MLALEKSRTWQDRQWKQHAHFIRCLLAITLVKVAYASAVSEGVEARGMSALRAPSTGATPSFANQ